MKRSLDIDKIKKSYNNASNARKSEAQKFLERNGTEFDDSGNIIVDLITETNNGKKNFGKVTYDAYKAIKGNTLDSYKPKNEEEKKVLDGYKQYTGMFINNGTSKGDKTNDIYVDTNKAGQGETTIDITDEEKQEVINSNSVLKKYNIDPYDFNYEDLQKWAEEHNHEASFTIEGGRTGFDIEPKKEGGIFGIGAKSIASKEEEKDAKVLLELLRNNGSRKMAQSDLGAVVAGGKNLFDGASFGLATTVSDYVGKKRFENSGLPEDLYTSYSQVYKKTEDEHPIAAFAGDVTGSLILTVGVGNLVRAGTAKLFPKFAKIGTKTTTAIIEGSKVGTKAAPGANKLLTNVGKWLSTSPVAREIINDGITFSITSAAREAGHGGSAEDVFQAGIRGLVSGGFSGGVEAKLGQIGLKFLFDKKLQHKILPEIARVSLSNAVGGTAYNLASYAISPADRKPTVEDMARDFAVDLAFGAIFSAKGTIDASKASKANIDNLYTKMEQDFKILAEMNLSKSPDVNGMKKLAQNVIDYSDTMQKLLKGEAVKTKINGETIEAVMTDYRFLGQNDYVKSMIDDLDTIKGRAKDFLDLNSKTSTDGQVSGSIPATSTDMVTPTTKNATTVTPQSNPNTDPPTVAPQTKVQNIKTGDVYENKEHGTTYTIVSRDDKNTTYTTTYSNGHTSTSTTDNDTADILFEFDNSLQKIKDGNTVTTTDVKTPTEQTTPVATEPRNTFTEELDEIANTEMPTVSAGETFVDNNTGKTIKVVSRDDTTTTVEITIDGKTETKTLPNKTADRLAVDDGYSKVETSAPTISKKKTVAENETTTPSVNVGDVYEATENGYTYTITARNDTHTTYTVTDKNGNTITRQARNTSADVFFNHEEDFTKLYTGVKVGDVYRNNSTGVTYTIVDRDANETTIRNNQTLKTFTKSNNVIDDMFAYEDVYTKVQESQPVTSINEENLPVTDESATGNKETSTDSVDLAEGEILTLKHTKNVYSLFKGAERVIVGKDAITDSYVAIPFSEEALDGVKKVAKKAKIENKPDFSLEKVYNKDNDVIIQRNPKVYNDNIKSMYVFKINNKFYVAQQKYIDAFNNGKNVIKANSKNYATPWTVHDENGNFVSLFCPVNNNAITDKIYSGLKSVEEVKQEKAKTNNVTKPTKKEVSGITETPKPETKATEEILQNQPESDTIEEKTDLNIGDVIELDGKRWKVKTTGFNMSFENLDTNDKETSFSHIGGMESFKNTHDYKVVTDNSKTQVVSENATTETEDKKETVSKGEASKQIADYVADKLAKGEKISAMELSTISTKAFGGTMADNVFSIKDAYDAMELGVNKYILSMKDVSADKMLELLELLPTQTKRTEEQVKFQQFSTPPSIAYLANYTANVNKNDVMLEPSAGIGGIAVFAKKDGAKVYVNELDARRLEVLKNMPFDGFFNEDAEQINNILGGELEPTVIVMNPPFSSSSERNMKNTKIGAKHIEQALKILAPNGRLVAIVGKGMADGEPAFRTWWKDIKSQYNVKANIGINGKNYNKYGTNFDIQMLVIDKNGPTTQTVTGYVDTLQELEDKLGGIRDERPAIDYSRNEQRTPTTTRTETNQTRETTDNGNRVVSDTNSVADKGKSADKRGNAEKPDIQEIQSTNADSRRTDNQAPEIANGVVDGQSLDRRGELRGNTELQDDGRTDISNSRQHSEQSDIDRSDRNVGTRQNDVRVQRHNRTKLTDSIFEQYQPQPLRVKNAQPHPAKVSESAAMSAIEPPPITYKPNLPQDIIDKGVVSDVQLEAISYAGQSHSQTLPNGTTRGFFLGDGTGIGKGRTIAGIILDNYNQGKKKAVWVTENESLMLDAKRDLTALFGNSDLLVPFKGGKKADKIFDNNEAILAVGYRTFSMGFDNKDSNFEKIVRWLGKDFDGVIVFDEAHNMANATYTKGTRGIKKPSQTGLAGIALQEALPKAKIVYSSATGATEVENLRYAERLGLWGDGTAFVTGDDFVSKVKAGGLAAMELIARDMKAMGVYLSRNISYDDVQYGRITHNLTTQQTKIYDELASSWQIVLQNINKALESTNQDKDGHARGRALGAFWSSQQRFFNQILTSMQVPSVISDIEKQLADGKSCVIQLVSTNEAAQNQEFERIKSEDLELDEFDLTPKQVLMSLIENSFPVQQFEEYRDDNGNIRSKPVYDSKGNPVVNREAVEQREELLAKLGSIKVPSSPIDMIINHFGTDLVAEKTGRARRVIQKDGKNIEENISNKKDADVDAFQNGNKRILIFSKAGGTGKSYHADKSAKNQQQRVLYVLEAGWQADNAVQGFGRVHRSNQASAPIIKLVTTNLKGQMRFISTIAKRLDQLGAMTKGQRQAGGQGIFSASDNLENSFAADVLAGFYKDLVSNKVDGIDNGLTILEKLGLKNKILDEYGRIIPTAPELRAVNKFLNRILSLESDEQNIVFEGYSQRLQDATEKAMQAGTLDKGLENYKADKITLNEVQDIREDERSGAKTKYYNLTAEHKIKPVNFENIPTGIKSFVGFYQNKNTGAVRAVFQTSSITDQYGNVTSNYKLMGQVKNEYIPQHRFYGNWDKLEIADAEKLWNEEVTKLPEYRQENLHLISGVVLPVWDKLPTENVRIYRVLTSDGEMLIGRVVSEDMIDQTLRRLGSSRTKEKIATKDLVAGIKNGNTVHLDNGWKIIQRKVAGENRIEIVGPAYEHHDILKEKGVFTERIQFNTRYFVPTDTNTEKIIDEILKLSPVMLVETEQYSISKKSEGINDETGNSLLSESGEWGTNESTRKQTKRISEFKQKIKGKTRAERQSITKELLEQGKTEEKVIGLDKFNIIKPEAYNDDMKKIIADAKEMGVEVVGFFAGQGKHKFDGQNDFEIDGIKLSDGKIMLRYDGDFTPQTLYLHEYIHTIEGTDEYEQLYNVIVDSLSETDKKKILSQERYQMYKTIYKNNMELVWKEFVADVMAGMSDYTNNHIDMVADFWNDGKVIDRYKVSEYSESIDAGNQRVLDNIGVGESFSVLSEDYTERALPKGSMINEYHKDLSNYEWWKYYQQVNNYDWDAELRKSTFDFYSIIGNKLIKSNYSKGKPKVVKIYTINALAQLPYEEGVIYDNDTKEILDKLTEAIESVHKGTDDNFSLSIKQQGTDDGRIINIDGQQLDTTSNYEVSEREDGTVADENIIRYSVSKGIDNDIEELTPERKKEILEQFERDRVGVDKPTQRQIWGERAEYIAHNMTRVFPDIPERGERGTFFAEFRKMMVQWKALPQTSMFMTQDKLNKMTKDLTPDEFKTFSELVYFLDLQEEAQIQKERGYEEILLPNEITPLEVDQIVDVLNQEATDNVRKALDNRRQIWDDLKEQYITLNQYIGFDTDGRFNRKNYYHHQVIEYMNQGGKGVAKGKEIEIKVGRGWLKERQGSTKATNTDFLAVEYKAMLQMQYDIYVANMLGKIKDQYDIKPQLEKQAFNHNKELLKQIIAEEATDENGNVMLDNKGRPDSETYRQQQWYNQRIMFGFSGLFDLAEAGMLPTFNGQYGNVIRALENHNLNVPGLYNYVGELASMELPETATDEELQARISARTVLKYTSQKKAWVKETLAGDYQTWETLAEDMKDTHSIHQPRRGNYFYTKTTIDEDAFNKAFNDMIVGLVAGENGVDTTADMKKLFEQYSETVRLMGAAYEQWVIPNEIETTMNKVANPKQVGVVSQTSRSILSAWKGWATSVNPLRTVKFGIRNLFGDLDAVIAGNPKVMVYSKQAVEEIYQAMKNKKYSPEFMEWVERGGYSSLIFANEMDTEMQDKLFSHLKDKEGLNIFKIPAKLYEGYYNGVETAHNFREAILRYSAYLYFKNEIIKNDGKVKDNVASNRYIIQGLQSVEDKAYQLSKDLLGAYDEVNAMGQAVRRHLIPFYSFTETNLKRYYRLFENIIMSDDNIPKKAGKLLLKGLMVNALTLLMVAWNRLVMKDEDDELPPSARNVPHITLGKIGDEVYAFRQLGSFSELLEWVGFEDYKWTEEDKTAALDKAVGMITPVIKTPVELLTGLNFYPSITQPRAIRDKVEHLFSTLGVDDIYRVVAGKPTKGIGDIVKGAVTYNYDYKESAYYEILDIKRKYQGDTDNTIYGQTPKSNALYYMKTAIRYKDKETALKYLDEYFENGGTAKGITQSMAMLNPMYGYTSKDTIAKGQEFVNSLNDDEKDKLKIAIDYYEKDLMLPENVSAMLRKKGITDEQSKNLLTNYINSKCK